MKTLKDFIFESNIFLFENLDDFIGVKRGENTRKIKSHLDLVKEFPESEGWSKVYLQEVCHKSTKHGNYEIIVGHLKNNKYQKIEYQYRDKEKNIDIDFLLGFQDNSWKLWIGKIGAITYDDDPWCDFKTSKFSEGIVAALDKVEEFIDDVEENPDNWVQFYKS